MPIVVLLIQIGESRSSFWPAQLAGSGRVAFTGRKASGSQVAIAACGGKLSLSNSEALKASSVLRWETWDPSIILLSWRSLYGHTKLMISAFGSTLDVGADGCVLSSKLRCTCIYGMARLKNE